MTRLLGLNDLISVRQLQSRGIQLDLERAVLWPHTPAQAALEQHMPLSNIAAQTFVLYPNNSPRSRAIGFLQARPRRGRPEADIAFISPSLNASEDAVAIWYRMLAECTQEIGSHGGQRLFAQLAGNNGAEEVFRQAGFSTYAREDIFRLTHWVPDSYTQEILRRQRARDGWTLLRLYAQLTPRNVQIAEGMLSAEGQGGKMGDWWDQSSGAGYIMEIDGELAGVVRVRRGRAAYWLRFWLHPQAIDHSHDLVNGALSLLRTTPRHPIYCGVRDYESGLCDALYTSGFEYLQTRSLLVKHTTVRVKESLLKFIPTLEKRAEPATSVSHHSESA